MKKLLYKYNDDFIYDELQYNKKQFNKMMDEYILFNKKYNAKILKEYPPYQDVKELIDTANYIKNYFECLVIVGMGGAILNPMIIQDFQKKDIKIIYLYTIESNKLTELEQKINLRNTAFLFISKSGETVETLALLITWKQKLENHNIFNFRHHFYFILGQQLNSIRRIAKNLNCIIFSHDDDISGRYATFSNIVLLPALIAEVDIKEFCMGAQYTLKDFFSKGSNSAPAKGGKFLYIMHENKKNIAVTMSYMYKTKNFLQWISQIVAESLGKNNKGITPIASMGPLDQHSQLQLYLDGPKDKFFTLIYNNNHQKNDINIINKYNPKIRSLGALLYAEYNAVLKTFIEKKLPTRTIVTNELNINSLGALAMHFIIETIVAGRLLNVNPFNQPAVAQIKSRTFEILNNL